MTAEASRSTVRTSLPAQGHAGGDGWNFLARLKLGLRGAGAADRRGRAMTYHGVSTDQTASVRVTVADPDYVLVLTTLPASHDAASVARALVQERLAACVNLLPVMRSMYRWEGSIEDEEERQLLIKTTRARVEDLRARVTELHPYEVPEFLVLPVMGGSEAYLRWISKSVAATN